jgi:hypothetical protein
MKAEAPQPEQLMSAVQELRRRVEDLFILQASIAGIGQREIRRMLGIDAGRVTKVAKHVKKERSEGR